jgi:hypothetical protein
VGQVRLLGRWYPGNELVSKIHEHSETRKRTAWTVNAVPAGTCVSLKAFGVFPVFLTVNV